MQHKKQYIMLAAAGALIAIVSGIALAQTQPVHAQCGSQASSCKNCHEVQAQKPVNNDGTAWHTSHAFGDFCYICHGGNQQATDKTAAHTGMVAPLADIQASCAQCHPNDLQARAQVYAVKLGVQIGAGVTPAASGPASATSTGPTTASVAPAVGNTSSTPQPAAGAPQQATPAPNDPNLVNYVQRYNENVLGEQPSNWGNVVFLILLGLIVLSAGFLVLRREGWITISFKETKPLDKELPSDVADMAPEIAKLKPAVRRSLRRLLSKPQAAAELLTAIDDLSPTDSTEKIEKEPSDPHNDSKEKI
jgi:hypothetical protein